MSKYFISWTNIFCFTDRAIEGEQRPAASLKAPLKIFQQFEEIHFKI